MIMFLLMTVLFSIVSIVFPSWVIRPIWNWRYESKDGINGWIAMSALFLVFTLMAALMLMRTLILYPAELPLDVLCVWWGLFTVVSLGISPVLRELCNYVQRKLLDRDQSRIKGLAQHVGKSIRTKQQITASQNLLNNFSRGMTDEQLEGLRSDMAQLRKAWAQCQRQIADMRRNHYHGIRDRKRAEKESEIARLRKEREQSETKKREVDRANIAKLIEDQRLRVREVLAGNDPSTELPIAADTPQIDPADLPRVEAKESQSLHVACS